MRQLEPTDAELLTACDEMPPMRCLTRHAIRCNTARDIIYNFICVNVCNIVQEFNLRVFHGRNSCLEIIECSCHVYV